MLSIKVFKVLLLIIIVFIAGCTYNGYRNKDEDTSVSEFITDSIGNVSNDVTNFVNGSTDYDLNIDTSIATDFIDSVKPKGEVTTFVEPTSYKPMITYEDINYPSEPRTVEDFEKVLLYMANQNLLELELHYSQSYTALFEKDTTISDNLSTAFSNITPKYIELFSNIRNSNFEMSGNAFSSSLKVKLNNSTIDDITLLSQEQYFEKYAVVINDALKEKKIITADMTQKEIAKELFTFVTRTLKYDTSFNDESYSGYGAVKNNTAVCQGYTALYNYLLKLNNIDCIGQQGIITDTGTNHIWTVATLDGKTSYIDVTFGDPIPDKKGYSNYKYFDASKEFLASDRAGVE